jgi:hypothetical protein
MFIMNIMQNSSEEMLFIIIYHIPSITAVRLAVYLTCFDIYSVIFRSVMFFLCYKLKISSRLSSRTILQISTSYITNVVGVLRIELFITTAVRT